MPSSDSHQASKDDLAAFKCFLVKCERAAANHSSVWVNRDELAALRDAGSRLLHPETSTAQSAWDAVNALIKTGDLGGSGWDKNAERNGLILAANAIAALPGVRAIKPSPEKSNCESVLCPQCKTELAFEGDVCGLCFPVAQP